MERRTKPPAVHCADCAHFRREYESRWFTDNVCLSLTPRQVEDERRRLLRRPVNTRRTLWTPTPDDLGRMYAYLAGSR